MSRPCLALVAWQVVGIVGCVLVTFSAIVALERLLELAFGIL